MLPSWSRIGHRFGHTSENLRVGIWFTNATEGSGIGEGEEKGDDAGDDGREREKGPVGKPYKYCSTRWDTSLRDIHRSYVAAGKRLRSSGCEKTCTIFARRFIR